MILIHPDCKFFSIFVLGLNFFYCNSSASDTGNEVELSISADTNSKVSEWWPSWPTKAAPSEVDASLSISEELELEANVEVAETQSSLSLLSPSSLWSYLSPDLDSLQLASDAFEMYYYPENTTYLSMATTLVKLFLFFMPGGGIVQQAYFIMDMTKISSKAAYMYASGHDTIDIATAIAPDLLNAVVLSRRDESYIMENTLHAGDKVNIGSMDANSFLQYVDSVQFPELPADQEEEIRTDVENVVSKYFPNVDPDYQEAMVDTFEHTIKFFALFTPFQDLEDSFSSEESEIDHVMRIIQTISSTKPKYFSLQKIKEIGSNVLF